MEIHFLWEGVVKKRRGTVRGRNRNHGFVRLSSGKNDVFDIHICPLNIFENQIVPVELHNMSKSLKPNLPTIRILSVGEKFIPKWKDTFTNFENFRKTLSSTVYFKETSPGAKF